MHIVFITPSPKTGGGNRVFIELANQLCSEHDVTILYPNNSSERHTFPVSPAVHFQPVGKLSNGKVGKLLNLIKTINYANRHYRGCYLIFSDPLFSIFSCLLKGQRLYRFIQADDYRIFDDGAILGNGILLKTFKYLTLRSYRSRKIHFIFNSRYVYETFLKDSKRNDIPYRLVHPAISHQIFSPSERELSRTRICLVARKHPLKGLSTFIDAYRMLSEEMKKRIDGITLISHDDLSDFNTSGMEILKPANDNDIANTYCHSAIFISSSWREGFGLPPLEAMACGCACIISDSGGVNEYAVPGQNCLMFPPKNTQALVDCLNQLLNDEALRNRLAHQGEIDSQRFSWETSARQLLDILKESK